MSDKKKDWDDIPSLEGLQMDWEYSGEGPLGKRCFERLTSGDVTEIFEVKAVPVRIATAEATVDGILSDVSGGGIAVLLNIELAVGQKTRIGLFLGRRKIVSPAVVMQAAPVQNGYRIGLQFENMKEEDRTYINGLYANKVLNR